MEDDVINMAGTFPAWNSRPGGRAKARSSLNELMLLNKRSKIYQFYLSNTFYTYSQFIQMYILDLKSRLTSLRFSGPDLISNQMMQIHKRRGELIQKCCRNSISLKCIFFFQNCESQDLEVGRDYFFVAPNFSDQLYLKTSPQALFRFWCLSAIYAFYHFISMEGFVLEKYFAFQILIYYLVCT